MAERAVFGPRQVKILGAAELAGRLLHLSKNGSAKAVRAGTKAQLVVLGRGMRKAIDSTDIPKRKDRDPASLKKEARKSIGSKVTKGGTNKMGKTTKPVAKVGFAVGKKVTKKTGEGKSRGVGASASNIHWFVLGTRDRHHNTTGKKVGDIGKIFYAVTEQAVARTATRAERAATLATMQVISREALKGR